MNTNVVTKPLSSAEALEAIVRPKSVVVVGANETLGKLTSGSVQNLIRHRYSGRLDIVNPNRREVFGLPTLARIDALQEVPDTAVIVLSAQRAVEALLECASVGIKTATIVASGFADGSRNGQSANEALKSALATTGIRLLGPNTAGLINLLDGYVPRASYNHPTDLKSGRVGVVAQSGGLCNTLVNRAHSNGVGTALAISTGNQVDLDMWDVGEYLLSLDDVDVVATIIEGFGSPQKFLSFARHALAMNKPVVALKLGQTESGMRAVATHSGSVAGSAEVQRAVMRDLNVIEVNELDELWEVASLVNHWGVPVRRTQRLGVVTPSGGDGAIVADEATRVGLVVPPPSTSTEAAYSKITAHVVLANPFDTQAALAVTGPETLGEQVATAASDQDFDAVLLALPVLATPGAVESLDAPIQGLKKSAHASVAVSMWTAGESTKEALAVVRQTHWPVFDSSIRAVRAIAHYDRYAAQRGRVTSALTAAAGGRASNDNRVPSYWSARTTLADLGVPMNDAVLVSDVAAGVRAAATLGYPVTVKSSSSAFTHKADAGAIAQGIRTEDGLREVVETFLTRWPPTSPDEGVVVEAHIYSSIPVFVGGHRDAEFGPFLLVGLGGSFTEAYADVARVPAPATRDQIESALSETKIASVLRKRPSTWDGLIELGARLSQEFSSRASIESFDVNPLLVQDDASLIAVDARVELSTQSENEADAHVGITRGEWTNKETST